MQKLYKQLTNLIDHSLRRLQTMKLCNSYSYNQIYTSFTFDYKNDIIKSNIALKLQISANDILGNINLKIGTKIVKEFIVKDNYILFIIHKNYKKSIYNRVFQKILCNLYGQLDNKNQNIIIDYNTKLNNSLSSQREIFYIQALKQLYQACGYNVLINIQPSIRDSLTIFNKIQSYIKENNNKVYLNIDTLNETIINNDHITESAKYIFTYLNLFQLPAEKVVSIRGKGYNIDYLHMLNNQYNLKNTIIQVDPFYIKSYTNKYSSFSDIQFDYINMAQFNVTIDNHNNILKLNCKEQELLQYSFIQHKLDNQYIFDINHNDCHLPYIQKMLKLINMNFEKMISLQDTQIYILIYSDWSLSKAYIQILNYILQYEYILELAAKNINLNILERYLFKLCHLASSCVYDISKKLDCAKANKHVDKNVLSQKLRIMKMIQYIIIHSLHILNISI